VKAAVCYEFGKPLVVEEVEIDPPNAGEIAVRVAACGVCHSDVSFIGGAWDGRLPAVYGHEAAGVVEAIGSGVERLTTGDHVVVTLVRACGRCPACAKGEPALCQTSFPLDERSPLRSRDGLEIQQGLRVAAFAEYAVLHESQAVAIPSDLPLVAASLLGCTVLSGFGAVVKAAQVEEGSSVVVIGAGGVGVNSVQAAALAGASPIVVLDALESKLDRAVVRSHAHGPCEPRGHAGARSRAVRGSRGGLRLRRRRCAGRRRAGPVAACAGRHACPARDASGRVGAQFDPGTLAHDGQRIIGSKLGSARPESDILRLVELYRQGRLKLDELVSGRYRLEEINDAVDSAARGEALRNVIVLG
jgi:S-(hydroxymethyl)glutathione dehydrogenase / alcohol dehydrogenase